MTKIAVSTELASENFGLIERTARRFGVDANKMMATLKATAFKGDVSNEQMMALLIVAEKYRLNPWTGELFAFPSKGGIVPVVSVDGWSRIMNEHPQFNGIEFNDSPEDDPPSWIECVIYRRDRDHPIKVRERFSECRRDTIPWKSHPARMLRHKAMIQCARIAFGFAGIYDEDEARRIIEAEGERILAEPKLGVEGVKQALIATAREPVSLVAPPTYAQIMDALEKATAQTYPVVRNAAEEYDGVGKGEILDRADARAVELGVKAAA